MKRILLFAAIIICFLTSVSALGAVINFHFQVDGATGKFIKLVTPKPPANKPYRVYPKDHFPTNANFKLKFEHFGIKFYDEGIVYSPDPNCYEHPITHVLRCW